MNYSPLEQFDVVPLVWVVFQYNSFFLELTYFNFISFLLFLLAFTFMLMLLVSRNLALVPTSWQNAFESLYNLVYNLLTQQVGVRGYIYFPFVFTLFYFILFANLFSLTPFSFALTSHIINIFFLSFTLVGGLFVIGLANFGLNFLKLFVPEAPFLLLLLLIPIELFSYLIRAFSLAIRLSANIMAGHTLVFIISSFLLKLSFTLLFFLTSLLLLVFMLELGVAFLQAYVFTILFTIYLRDSLWEPAH
jgi:F-type H+-transporting ATPase subunit a